MMRIGAKHLSAPKVKRCELVPNPIGWHQSAPTSEFSSGTEKPSFPFEPKPCETEGGKP